jgi:outer membrane protein assembly factor BamD
VRNAPYGHLTARAQYDIGRAREKQGSPDLAIEAYQSLVEKFPNDPLAVDAQYQIGYIWFSAAKAGTYDPEAPGRARVAFEDFLYRYPKSEKASQARENLALIEKKETKGSLEIAQYYDKAKRYRAAVVYYNEVIRLQPGSAESEIAKKRIAQLRAKVGDAALQSAATVAERNAKNNPKKTAARGPSSIPPEAESAPLPPETRGSARELAPLPVDSDSLPPAAAPDVPSPFDSLPAPDPSAAPEATAAPEPSATPEETAAP